MVEQASGGPVERSVALVVRLTPAEREGWHAAARAAGWGKTAGWVRQVVADRLSPSSSSSSGAGRVVADELAGVRRELVRIGSNVNQLAFQVNAGAVAGRGTDAELLRRELAAVRGELGALRAAVARRVEAPPAPAPTSAPAPSSPPPRRRVVSDREVWAGDQARVDEVTARLADISAKIAALKAKNAARQEGRR